MALYDTLDEQHRSRVMTLFDTVVDKYHQAGMDNLYNSVAFCRAAYNHSNKVLVHGVARKGGRGVPPCVLQQEETKKNLKLKA